MKKKYKQYYDADTDSYWVVFKKGAETYYEEIAPGVNVEFGKNSEIIGIEIQNCSRLLDFNSSAKNTKNIGNVYEYPNILNNKYLSPSNYGYEANSPNSLSLN